MLSGTVAERTFLHWSSWAAPPDSIEVDTRTAWTITHYWSAKTQTKPETRDEPLQVGSLYFEKDHPLSKFFNFMMSVAKTNSELLKEYIFDEVRALEFPDLPSRRRCVFFLDAVHDPHEYINQLGWVAPTTLYEATVVEGTLHRAKLSLLNCNTLSPPELREQARRYWQKADVDLGTEVLFEGIMRLRRVT